MKEGSIRIVLPLLTFAGGVSVGFGLGGFGPDTGSGIREASVAALTEPGAIVDTNHSGLSQTDSHRSAAHRPGPGTDEHFSPSTHVTAAGRRIVPGDTLVAIRDAISNQSTGGKLEYLELLQRLTPEEAPKMLALFRELSYRGYKVADYDRLFWERWAEIDGQAASAKMFSRDKRFKETNLSKLAIGTWAKNDPEAASQWLFSQDDIPLREGMTKGLLEGMAERDPASTQRFLESADLSDAQTAHGYGQIARQYQIKEGLDSVGDWYRGFSEDDPVYDIVTNATTQIYARAEFADALNWANTLEGSPEAVARTRGQLHARLAYGRPDGLLTFLGNDPTADTLTGAESLAARAVSRWIVTNPNAMGEWLQKNSAIRNYDLVAAPFVEQIAPQDLVAAQAWADTLRDANLRNTVKDRIIGN